MLAAAEKYKVVVPGDRLGSTAELVPGAGTYQRDDHVFASVVGCRREAAVPVPGGGADGAAAGGGAGASVRVVEVIPPGGSGASGDGKAQLPVVGSIVTGRVLRITDHQANVAVLVVDDKAVQGEAYLAVIRKENIREGDIDRIRLQDCFRPGDLVVAEVVSLGDSRSYFLSTVKPGHGIVWSPSKQCVPAPESSKK